LRNRAARHPDGLGQLLLRQAACLAGQPDAFSNCVRIAHADSLGQVA
jgi:hypothetical protein